MMSALARLDDCDGDCTARAPVPGGAIETIASWRDYAVNLGANFQLESGETLNDPFIRLRAFGRKDAPVVIAAGGISAGRKVADADDQLGWWRDLARSGGAIDTDQFQVIGFDFLPGSESEAKTITPNDQARALAFALDAIDIGAVHGFVGASYGGFVGLAFAALYPERLDRLCVISAAARSAPMTTAIRGIQRRIITLAADCGREKDGVALARELAMTTYRTADEFRARFQSSPCGDRAGDPYDVCNYLTSRGKAYAEATPASRYLTLSDSLDRADIDPEKVLADCLFIGAASDRLVPASDIKATSTAVTGRSSFLPIESLVGHDAFLCDIEKFETPLKTFVEGDPS